MLHSLSVKDDDIYTAKGKDILCDNGVCNIMVVDDDDDILFTIKTGLEEKGFKIHTFRTAESAIESFEHHPLDYYDLALTDIYMPNMNGFALYLCLKEKQPSLKIAFMTASFDIPIEESRAVVPSIEPNNIIQKPFSITDLATRIRYILLS
jgi:DNA-binding response OmpR family regulator